MLIHERFVFLEMRKTGCTFVAEALKQALLPGSLRSMTKHMGWAGIPPEAAGRPVLMYVRNPWDWYVSWYHFNLLHPELRNQEFWVLSEGGTLDFDATVRNACRLQKCHIAAVGLSPKLCETLSGKDLYMVFFNDMVGEGNDCDSLTIGRFESLIDDLADFLVGTGIELPDGALARIRAMAPVNSSGHRPYHEYYDEELRDLVGRASQPLIERFEYSFA